MKINFTPHLKMLVKCMCYTFAWMYSSGYLMAASDQSISVEFVMIDFSCRNASVTDVFEDLQSQTSFSFFFDPAEMSRCSHVTIAPGRQSVAAILEEISHQSGLKFRQINNTIAVSMKSLRSVAKSAEQKNITIRGHVQDENGESLPGVTIVVKGAGVGTISDVDGNYSLNVAEDATLTFSSIGFKTEDISVTGKTVINVTMTLSLTSLDDVVVVAYGETSERENTGSVATVKSDVIEKQPISNPLLALQGQMAGVYINQASGKTGGNVSVQIRGLNSISSSSIQPLYIVDGVPYSGTPLNQFEYLGNPPVDNTSPFNSLNPDNIESVSVLKDADATAIYGSRGANGVVIITTKKHQSGAPFSVQANVYGGVKQLGHKMNLMNTSEYLGLRQEAFDNDGITPTTSNAPDLTVWDQTRNTDWQDKLMGGNGGILNATLGISGGQANSSFAMNTSYRKEGTIYPGDFSYEKIAVNTRYNLHSSDNKFNMGLSANYMADDNRDFGGDPATNVLTPTNFNPYSDDGSIDWSYSGNPMGQFLSTYHNKTSNLIGTMNLEYQFYKDLSLKVTGGYNQQEMNQVQKNPSTSSYYSSIYRQDGTTKVATYNIEPQLNYNKKIASGKLTVLVGGTMQRTLQNNLYIYSYGFDSDVFLDNIAGASSHYLSKTLSDYRYLSAFSRVNYNWKGKYIINGSFRRDGSSRFGPDNRFGNFGAVGAAWIFTEESFMKGISWLSYGKLRSSYGATGNDQIGNYGYYQLWTASDYRSESSTVLTPSSLTNKNYSWEKVVKFDAALELGFVKDRFLINVDYYNNATKDQLVGQPLSLVTGFSSVTANLPALIRNNGWELSLTSRNFVKSDFKWSTSVNLTIPHNKLVRFKDFEGSSYSSTYILGKPITLAKGYVSSGVDPETGTVSLKDLNGDGAIDYTNDRKMVGNTLPKFYGGFQNSFTYKNWQLDVFFQFTKKNAWDYDHYTYTPVGGLSNFHHSALRRWQQPGDITDVAKATTVATSDFYYTMSSTSNWVDASFIRLKNVQITYNVPSKWLSSAKINQASIYLQGQNLYTWTKYKGMDPETGYMFAPPLRMLMAGIRVGF